VEDFHLQSLADLARALGVPDLRSSDHVRKFFISWEQFGGAEEDRTPDLRIADPKPTKRLFNIQHVARTGPAQT